MKAVLICPADRPAVSELALRDPLAIVPLFGRSVLALWIEALVSRGVKHFTVLASDRPHRVREHVGDGRRWGAEVEVVPTSHELSPDEALRRFRRNSDADTPQPGEIQVIDHLPDAPEFPLFDSYEGWFAAQRAWMPRAVTIGRIGVREVAPGVWAGLRAEIARDAQLTGPCWIGDYVRIGRGARIGPGAVLEDRVIVDEGATVTESTVAPDTYVGKFVSVERSLAHGRTLISWQTDSSVSVPDAFLLADLAAQPRPEHRTTLAGRLAAGVAMGVTAPFAVGVILLSVIRGEAPWHLRLGLRCQPGGRRLEHATFAYYELGGAYNWLRRWPQLWNIVRGDMAWTGNRPLRPTQALLLTNDFERLWLAAPVGLISLADAHGCPDGISDEATAHASYYAVHESPRLDWFILSRSLARAAVVWPIRGQRRKKEAAVPLQDLVSRQEL